MLMRDERLATLATKFDDATRDADHLPRRQAGGARPARHAARPAADRAVHRRLHEVGAARAAEDRASAPGHSFSDVAAKCVHIVNLASVRELERDLGRPVDPLRFRANVYLEGLSRGRSSAGSTRSCASARPRWRSSRARRAARRPTSIRRPARATWRSRPHLSAPGVTRISASMPRSRRWRDRNPDARDGPFASLAALAGRAMPRVIRAEGLPCRVMRLPRPRCAPAAPDGAKTRAAHEAAVESVRAGVAAARLRPRRAPAGGPAAPACFRHGDPDHDRDDGPDFAKRP